MYVGAGVYVGQGVSVGNGAVELQADIQHNNSTATDLRIPWFLQTSVSGVSATQQYRVVIQKGDVTAIILNDHL